MSVMYNGLVGFQRQNINSAFTYTQAIQDRKNITLRTLTYSKYSVNAKYYYLRRYLGWSMMTQAVLVICRLDNICKTMTEGRCAKLNYVTCVYLHNLVDN